MLRIITLFLLLFTSINAHAVRVELTNFTLWTNHLSLEVIRVSLPSGVISNPSGCSNPDSYYVPIALSAATQQRIYSMLLTAKIVSVPVQIWVNGCEAGADGSRPAIMDAFLP